jgi:hypothetical protein
MKKTTHFTRKNKTLFFPGVVSSNTNKKYSNSSELKIFQEKLTPKTVGEVNKETPFL